MIFCRLGGRFGHLGGSWGVILKILARLGALLGRVDASGGAALDFTGGLGSVFGLILGAKRAPRRSPKRPKIDQKIVLKNDRVLDRS